MPADPTPLLPREILEALGRFAAAVAASVPAPAGDPPPELLDRRQTAALLGLSLTGFADLEARGFVGPAPIRLGDTGRVVRYSRTQLLAWVAGGCVTRSVWAAIRNATNRRAG